MRRPDLKSASDPRGSYLIDWTVMQDGGEIPRAIEFIPFAQGDARVLSVPADEMIYVATGSEKAGLTHGIIAMRLGQQSVHTAMSPDQLRFFASKLNETADLITAGRKGS